MRKLRALKLKSDRVNSAAVIVQRSMKTRFLKGEISVDRAIAIKAHQVRHKSMDLVYGFLSAITDTVIEEEIEETIDLAAPEWLERKMKEAEEEAVRLSLERTMFELEITNMFGEDILEIAHAEETKRETVESGQMALEDCLDGTEEDSLFNTDQSIVDGDSTIPYDEELGFSDSVVDFISKAMSKTMMKLSRDPYDETENFAIPDEGSKKFVEEVIFSALRSVYKDKSSLAATFYVSQAIEEAINKSTGNVIALNRISEIEYIARKVSGIVVAEVLQNKIFQQKMITPEGEELLEAEVTQEVSPPKSEDLPDPTAIEDNVLDAVDRKVIIDIEEELHSASVDESEDPPVLTKDDALSLGMTEIEFEDFNAVYNDSRKAFSDAKYRQSIERATKCESMLKRFSTKIREKNEFVKIETAVWLMLGNAYFAIANYNESQRFLEDAFNSRSATFGSRHVLVAEAALYYAEWHRSQARYNEAETFYFQVH